MPRKKKPVLERVKNLMPSTDFEDTDSHWIWPNIPPKAKKHKMVLKQGAIKVFRDNVISPPRIRDDDGKLKSVSRILYREIIGGIYPYTLKRSHGCDYRCVNPYHLGLPDTGDNAPIETGEEDIIEVLTEEIINYIGAYGRDNDAIFDRYMLDYTQEEIEQALERIK